MKELCDEVGFVYYLIIARLYDLDPKLNKNERTITALHNCLDFYVNVCFSFLASFLLLPNILHCFLLTSCCIIYCTCFDFYYFMYQLVLL